jgi:hypothetical protein
MKASKPQEGKTVLAILQTPEILFYALDSLPQGLVDPDSFSAVLPDEHEQKLRAAQQKGESPEAQSPFRQGLSSAQPLELRDVGRCLAIGWLMDLADGGIQEAVLRLGLSRQRAASYATRLIVKNILVGFRGTPSAVDALARTLRDSAALLLDILPPG